MNRFRNLVLSALSPEDLAALVSEAAWVDFVLGDTVTPPGPIEYLHFPESGILSAVVELADGRSVEAYMLGFEGVTGVSAASVPAETASRYVCQSPSRALRVEARRVRRLAAASPAMREVFASYEGRLQAELQQSSACNALHHAGQRLAKWLLRCHDRIDGDTVYLTQDYLAAMLGAQRTTVNEAAQALQGDGAIRYARGKLTVTSRGRLERASCECYARPPAVDALLGHPVAGEARLAS
jgi:CRP-like cAMP-binding protein